MKNKIPVKCLCGRYLPTHLYWKSYIELVLLGIGIIIVEQLEKLIGKRSRK